MTKKSLHDALAASLHAEEAKVALKGPAVSGTDLAPLIAAVRKRLEKHGMSLSDGEILRAGLLALSDVKPKAIAHLVGHPPGKRS